MKKNLLIIVCIFIIIVLIILGYYYNYQAKYSELKKFNLEYENYLDKEIYGAEIATVINKAIDNNEKNEVEKRTEKQDDKEYYFYVPNDTNSINIDVKITGNKTTMYYKMESLYQGELETFVQLYNTAIFKCTKIEYNKVGKVKYLLFEQITQ